MLCSDVTFKAIPMILNFFGVRISCIIKRKFTWAEPWYYKTCAFLHLAIDRLTTVRLRYDILQ